MRILVADDDGATRNLLKLYLSKWGHECVLAEDGTHAWELFQAHQIDIVLSDWLMPGMEGPVLCRRIREVQENGSYTYVILCTVQGDTRHIVEGMEAGADDYVTKPFQREELKVRIEAGRRVLELHRSLSESNRRMEQALEQAATTLINMLPIRSSGPTIKIDWLFRPSAFVGGDIFNVFEIDDRHTGFYAIDVCGHGVSSALFAVSLRNMIRPVALPNGGQSAIGMLADEDFIHPARVASALNSYYSMDEQSVDTYFTMFYGVVDRKEGILRWVRAGHPPPILVGESTSFLDAGDRPIGLLQDSEYEERETELAKGDRLFLYSDGITEASSPSSELFGLKRLASLVTEKNKSI